MRRNLVALFFTAFAVQALADPCVFQENNLVAPPAVSDSGGPVVVDVHVYLNDLIEIKDAQQSFVGDVFLRAGWIDSRLAHSGTLPCSVNEEQIWTPELQILNRRVVDRFHKSELKVAPDGRVVQVTRAYGEFSFSADLTDFPFDRQELYFALISGKPLREVEMRARSEDMGLAEQLSVANWKIDQAVGSSGEYYVAPVDQTFSRFDVLFEAQRLTGYYSWQLLVPLFLVVMMTWTVFWMPLEFVAPRVGLVATSMLTLIAYRFSMASILPPIAYLTRLDIFMVASSVLVFAALATAVAVTYLEGRGDQGRAARLNYVARWLAPLLFLAAFARVFLV